MIVRRCEKCGHEWAPRKPVPPKRCPRCQHLYSPTVERSGETEKVDPFAEATPEQIRYLVGVLEILKSNDPVFAEGIRRAVDSFTRTARNSKRAIR
ncbi:MAG: hypothetical protein IT168_33360 [Bryobacterales bacterium]|nr:hypothetical protein [Bryobacterales bacterium]